MLCLRIVQYTKYLNTRNQILEPLPVSALLVLEYELIDLPKRKRLVLDKRANVFHDILLAVCHVVVNFISDYNFSVQDFLSFFVDMKEQKVNGLHELEILRHQLVRYRTKSVYQVKYLRKLIDGIFCKLFVEMVLFT